MFEYSAPLASGEVRMIETQTPDHLFDVLLKRHESDTLDFKRELHDFTTAEGRDAFVKDVVCLANTPRNEPSYLVFGVDYTPEAGTRLIGLSHQEDGAKIVDQLDEKHVQPRPTVHYIPVSRESKAFGILEIPVQTEIGRPFLPARDLAGMKCHDVWLRRDSKNGKANADDLMRVFKWFNGGEPTATPAPDTTGEWDLFLQTVCRFENGRYFLMISDRMDDASDSSHAGLGLAPWLGVFDFDPQSELTGLLAAVATHLKQRRNLHLVVKGQDQPIYPHGGTTWFFARGLAGRKTTVQTGPYKVWMKDYGRELGNRVRAVASAINPAPITVVVLWNDLKLKDHLGEALGEVAKSFGDEATVVLVSQSIDQMHDLCEKYGALPIHLSPRAIALGMSDFFTVTGPTSGRCALPTKDDGITYSLERNVQLWLEEELELVHLDVGLQGDRSPNEFARGEVVSWRDLQLHYDSARELTDKLRQRIEKELRERHIVRVNLYHAAGAGGTTVARRVQWDLHTRHPCVVLHRCFEPTLTADRLGRIYGLTQQSILLLVDGSEHSESTVNQLYDSVRSQQTPVVMLQVLRRFNPAASPQRDFLLKAELTRQEADRFQHAYARLVPARASALAARADSAIGQERTAFFFGLEAFGRDFLGLQKFVESRIGDPGHPVRKILGFLAIAHCYAQQSLPAQSFARLLQLPRDRRLDFRRALPAEALELLVEVDADQWRIAHIFIAEEILRQVLWPQPEDRERLWPQALSTWAIDFADFTRGEAPVPGEQMLEVARRTFIFRDNAELLGTERSAQKQFSQLLEEIPSPQGKLEVLRKLTEVYPDEAHFHAHFGRLCGLNGRYDEALEAVDRALKLNDSDSVLHHMRGMTLRYQVQELIDRNQPLEAVLALTKQAHESFVEARRLNPDNEHGYISEVQLLIRVLDYGAKLAKRSVPDLLSDPRTDPFLRESIDLAEELLEQVSAGQEGEKASHFAEDCRARLDSLYGDHSKALQIWDNLLSRKDVYKPPLRRQVIWTILRRRGGDWAALEPKELNRCLRMLTDNFDEVPNDNRSLRLWLRAIRFSSNPPTLDNIVERISYWKANTNSLDAAYYLYILHALASLEGSVLARYDAERAIEDCKSLASRRRNRRISFEWLGKGKGITRLIHYSQLGEKSDDGFWKNRQLLERVEGRIISIDAPQQGRIELYDGQIAFFVPAFGDFHAGGDENRRVDCCIGFSYDGPRAWNVHPIDLGGT
ncbi:MAG: RNA-binding domain-containing protein [Planctomycetales bacterium]